MEGIKKSLSLREPSAYLPLLGGVSPDTPLPSEHGSRSAVVSSVTGFRFFSRIGRPLNYANLQDGVHVVVSRRDRKCSSAGSFPKSAELKDGRGAKMGRVWWSFALCSVVSCLMLQSVDMESGRCCVETPSEVLVLHPKVTFELVGVDLRRLLFILHHRCNTGGLLHGLPQSHSQPGAHGASKGHSRV